MPGNNPTKQKSKKESYDLTKAPSQDLQTLIDDHVEDYLNDLIEDDLELPKVSEMMRGYFEHLQPLDQKLKGISKDQITCSCGIGKAIHSAVKNARRRHLTSAEKEKRTA